MTGRSKLRWVDIPRHSLRDGLACEEGGVRLMLFMGDDRQPAGLSPVAAASRDSQSDARADEKPR